MPKGVKEKDAAPPEQARCDFCGRVFKPLKWNSRTCLPCHGQGMPDQSLAEWTAYQEAVKAVVRSKYGRKKPKGNPGGLRRAALALRVRRLAESPSGV